MIKTKNTKKQSRRRLFRIGTTSYIYPDEILPNVDKLKDKIGDIELVLFEFGKDSNIPSPVEVKKLRRLSREHDFTYTVHLPLDIDLGGRKREVWRRRAGFFFERFAPLFPYAYVLHLNLPEAAEKNLSLWQERVEESLKRIAHDYPRLSRKIVIENLSYPFEYIDRLIIENNYSICVDIGHLICRRIDPLEHLDKYFKYTRLIHLHGVKGTRDHVSLKHFDRGLLKRLMNFLKKRKYRGVITLEVFSEKDFNESREVLWEN
ncbi:MAG: cobamide remodeling phosphodiesterase CbiR [Candidatus Omnitrophica bacterium]|nr:cobamide remodeling phosphodiesterase CbiR [Candidatus Omnitrophota bacterium]